MVSRLCPEFDLNYADPERCFSDPALPQRSAPASVAQNRGWLHLSPQSRTLALHRSVWNAEAQRQTQIWENHRIKRRRNLSPAPRGACRRKFEDPVSDRRSASADSIMTAPDHNDLVNMLLNGKRCAMRNTSYCCTTAIRKAACLLHGYRAQCRYDASFIPVPHITGGCAVPQDRQCLQSDS
ncbi:hypothetical protein BD414DRAFT_472124 [Trametes punicea]|nr:hypothetical protein BD414DRAFT_472124 [Trametes punicea]